MFGHLHCPRNLVKLADILFFIATEFIACHRSIYFLYGTFGVIIFIYVPQSEILGRKGLKFAK